MGASRDFLTFFPAHPWRSDRPTDFDAKWLKQRAFTQGWYFCSKNRNFSYPLMFRTPKRSKFRKFLDFENFRSIWPLTLEVQREYTPYSSSEPNGEIKLINESGIVNRQSGGEKLKYVLKFYIGGAVVHVTWYGACAMTTQHCVYEQTEIQTWGQWTTNGKWPIPSPMVTLPMTSRDLERSRSWPQYG